MNYFKYIILLVITLSCRSENVLTKRNISTILKIPKFETVLLVKVNDNSEKIDLNYYSKLEPSKNSLNSEVRILNEYQLSILKAGLSSKNLKSVTKDCFLPSHLLIFKAEDNSPVASILVSISCIQFMLIRKDGIGEEIDFELNQLKRLIGVSGVVP